MAGCSQIIQKHALLTSAAFWIRQPSLQRQPPEHPQHPMLHTACLFAWDPAGAYEHPVEICGGI